MGSKLSKRGENFSLAGGPEVDGPWLEEKEPTALELEEDDGGASGEVPAGPAGEAGTAELDEREGTG